MAIQHFLYSAETAYGTWVTPAKALWVESASLNSGREVIDLSVTGQGRAPVLHVLGAKPVSGEIVTPWWNAGIGTILKGFIRDTATTGSYVHGFLFNDAVNPLGLSVQIVQNTGTVFNYLSAVVNSFTIAATNKEQARLTFTVEAKDEALAGGTWDWSGGASPAAVANPDTLYPTLARPLMFYDGTITMSGTPSLNDTTNVISIGSGTTYAKVIAFTVTVNLNVDTEGYGITTDPTRQEIVAQNRGIDFNLEMSWTDYATTFYSAARAGTAMAFEADFTNGSVEGHVVLPSIFFDPVQLPAISGDHSKPTLAIVGRAQVETTTDQDFNLWIANAEATI